MAHAPASTGILYVVATPIGNLSDITLRAIETLREVPLIAAEDTRLTHRLLSKHGIDTPSTSFHARSAPSKAMSLLQHLRSGASLALVTDAGTPIVSDPGGELVGAWIAEGGRVVPIPGPSAVLAAVSATGIAGPRWVFEGFLPRSGRDRRERLRALAADARGCVVFEAPSRVAATIDDLVAACGPDRQAAICRELTKLHEQVVVGPLGELAAGMAGGSIPARGEFVLVLGMASTVSREPDSGAARAAARAAVERLVVEGIARGDAARRIARETGIPRRQLYGEPSPDANGTTEHP
jgi:16S rRNA (cytidine1402-2'-O)-methyltransferase